MKKWITFLTTTLACIVISKSAFGQEQADRPAKVKEEKLQEIVIRKKPGKTEKMTIVVDGDNVTINGKPVEEFENKDITVLKRQRPLAPGPRARSLPGAPGHFNGEDFDHLIASSVNRGVLGVVTDKADDGVRVTDVTKESGADKAGIKKEDVIIKVDDKVVKSPGELISVIRNYKPKESVDVTYKRDGKEFKTSVVLGENKFPPFSFNLDNHEFNFNFPKQGLPSMENFNFNFSKRPKIGLQIQDVSEGNGVIVKDVDEASPASKAGIKEGDIITRVNDKDVVGIDDVRKEINELREGETVKFSIRRAGKNQTVELKLPRRIKTADL